MCVLSRIIEAAGIATVALMSVREVAERLPPPRTLYGNFPLGRPLGRPGDPEFQHDVLARAFGLLDAESGPVLADHPVVIESDDVPMECALPPRYNPSLPPAVDEALGLRAAFDRRLAQRGVTSVGRVLTPDDVPDALAALARIADGTKWKEAGLVGDPVRVSHDLRAYYDEAAQELVDRPPDAGRFEAWFYEETEAGRTLLAARAQMQEQEAPFPLWFYMARATR